MSIEAANAFMELAERDPALQAEAVSRFEAGGLAAVAELAAGRGYQFTAEEAEVALAAPPSGELSDRELEAVAGGAGTSKQGFRSILFPVFKPAVDVGRLRAGIARIGALPEDP